MTGSAERPSEPWGSPLDYHLARRIVHTRIIAWLDGLDRGELEEVRHAVHPDRIISVLEDLLVPPQLMSSLRFHAADAYVALGRGDESAARRAIRCIRDAWLLQIP